VNNYSIGSCINRLTVVIPFLNEGEEIENTVKSIRETAGNNVDIILINDCSSDGYDYRSVSIKYNTQYCVNEQRMGVAESRNIGVSIIETPYFILLDGHMRVYNNNWWSIIENALANDDRAVYCLECKGLDSNYNLKRYRIAYGAYIKMFEESFLGLLEPEWIRKDLSQNRSIIQIPCVLGACYAMSKRYWDRIQGLKGLRTYGCDEVYLSIKTWLEGGKCILFKEIEVGHIFRNEFPYIVNFIDRVYNKLLIAEVLFPENYKSKVFNKIERLYPLYYSEAITLLSNNKDKINELKIIYDIIFINDFESFLEYNNFIKLQIN